MNNTLQKIRSRAWACIADNRIFWHFFTKYSVLYAKVEMYTLFRKYSRSKTTLQSIFLKISNKGQICHILGNGTSALNTLKYISKDECVIAMNTGIFYPVHINVYMTELHNMADLNLKNGSISLDESIICANQIYDYVLNLNPKCVMIIKNMMKDNVSPNLYDPKNRLITLLDIVYKYFPLNDNYMPFQKFLINYILNEEEEIIIQTSSSVTTAITLAYKAGFKNIYVHGLDGGGNHYFHDRSLENGMDANALNILAFFKKFIPQVQSHEIYVAGKHSLNTFQLFVEVAKERGITLCRAEELIKESK